MGLKSNILLRHTTVGKKLNSWKIDFSDFTIFDISFYFQQLFNYLPTAVGRKVDSCNPNYPFTQKYNCPTIAFFFFSQKFLIFIESLNRQVIKAVFFFNKIVIIFFYNKIKRHRKHQ